MSISQQNTLRLFIAFELPASAKKRLADVIEQLKSECAGDDISPRAIKWVEPESIHLTTQFLGDMERQRVGDIEKAVSDIHDQFEKRALVLDSKLIGAFPNLNRPRVIWANLTGDDLLDMKRIAGAVTDGLIKIRCFSDIKPFKPHLTLGRIRRDTAPKSLQAVVKAINFETIEVAFETLTLFASELTPEGPIHTRLHSWEFTA